MATTPGRDLLVVALPVDEIDPVPRRALLRWLWEHGIAPATLVVDRPVERDDSASSLVWHERRDDGTVVKRWRFAPVLEGGTWPAPFPSLSVAQVADDPGVAAADGTADTA